MGLSGIAGIGSSLGTDYDFTKMTNAQLLNAANKLGSEGKISELDASQLAFIAQGVDSVPISGPSPSVSQILSDPTQQNFVDELQNIVSSMNSQPGSVGTGMYESMLKDLQTYQASPIEDTGKSSSIDASL
jgi:hypothetical protein